MEIAFMETYSITIIRTQQKCVGSIRLTYLTSSTICIVVFSDWQKINFTLVSSTLENEQFFFSCYLVRRGTIYFACTHFLELNLCNLCGDIIFHVDKKLRRLSCKIYQLVTVGFRRWRQKHSHLH